MHLIMALHSPAPLTAVKRKKFAEAKQSTLTLTVLKFNMFAARY